MRIRFVSGSDPMLSVSFRLFIVFALSIAENLAAMPLVSDVIRLYNVQLPNDSFTSSYRFGVTRHPFPINKVKIVFLQHLDFH